MRNTKDGVISRTLNFYRKRIRKTAHTQKRDKKRQIEVLTAVSLMSVVFWDVRTCSLADVYWYLEEHTASIFGVVK
jgi:hypothetical protein